ncbi:class I SAM-dependent methyltransferase [Nanchangia anserum]|uniref:class I SAM-dependent methyltransferase n=1 Tax=Nanchangia anserum TaxID=2692125 RepID=UPI001D1253A5|nr:class I SAM-dependent methyltransferase [Nanchangia anserum]
MRHPLPPGPGDVTDPLGLGAGQASLDNPYERADSRYHVARPPYPDRAVDFVYSQARTAGGNRIVDIGAGTGLMSAPLSARGAQVTPVEPAEAMVAQLRRTCPELTPVVARGEETGLPSGCADLVVYAQSWHWLDPTQAAAEAARLLTPSGRVCVVFNQLDTRIGWVKRLTRIMRSGDIHTPDRPPRLGPRFTRPTLDLVAFSQRLTPDQIGLIGQTRSSYLRASDAGRAHMRANLDWYLHDFLAIPADLAIDLPSLTLVWSAHLISPARI